MSTHKLESKVLLMNEYFSAAQHIILTEPASSNTLETILSFSELLINAGVILGGVWAISQIKRFKEKRLDTTFSYLLRLEIRMNRLLSLFKQYKNNILDCLVVPGQRKHNLDASNSYISDLVIQFARDAAETRNFLMNMDDQIPIYLGWMDQYSKFVEFLELYNNIAIAGDNYYIWSEDVDGKKQEFFNEHSTNMEDMLSKIYDYQKELEEKINLSQKGLIKKICEFIKSHKL